MSPDDSAELDSHIEESNLLEAGLLEPGQPTLAAHNRWRRWWLSLGQPLTPAEIRNVRLSLLGARYEQ